MENKHIYVKQYPDETKAVVVEFGLGAVGIGLGNTNESLCVHLQELQAPTKIGRFLTPDERESLYKNPANPLEVILSFPDARSIDNFIETLSLYKKSLFPSEEAKESKMKPMIETKHDLLTTKYTRVLEEKDFQFNAPHTFEVVRKLDENTEFNPETDLLAKIHFQEGPIKENGVNGVCNEDLLVMVIRRLQGFQESEFKCRENAMAITKLEEALLWLRKRTLGRENRGVEGTHAV